MKFCCLEPSKRGNFCQTFMTIDGMVKLVGWLIGKQKCACQRIASLDTRWNQVQQCRFTAGLLCFFLYCWWRKHQRELLLFAVSEQQSMLFRNEHGLF